MTLNARIAELEQQLGSGEPLLRAAVQPELSMLEPTPLDTDVPYSSYEIQLAGWIATEYQAPYSPNADTLIVPCNVSDLADSVRVGMARRHAWLCIGRKGMQVRCSALPLLRVWCARAGVCHSSALHAGSTAHASARSSRGLTAAQRGCPVDDI